MKKLLLSILVLIAAYGLAPVAQSQTQCQANFTYVIGTVTPNGAPVTFFDSSFAAGNITNWNWSFGNGTGSTMQNPVGFLNPGINIVCLTIVSVYQNQTCTDMYCDTIVIGNIPCNASFLYVSGPQGASFYANAFNNVSWNWSFGDGISGTGSAPLHVYASPGNYTVCLTVTDAIGDTCTSCQTIGVGALTCVAAYTSSNVQGTSIYDFTNQSQGNATYFYWSFGDGTTSTLENPSHTYNGTGWFNVCLTITDSVAQCSDTECDSVFVGGGVLCDPNFVYQSSPTASVFIATGQNNASWSWDFGDGTTSTSGPTATHSYSAAGTYLVCLTATVANGGPTCTSCQNVVIQNAANCSSNFAIYPDSVTQHTYYAYNLATGVAPLNYTWSWGDGTSSNTAYPSHTYSGPGLYTICLTITDATGCTSNTCYQWQLLRLSGSGVPVTINVLPGTTGIQETGIINALTVYPNPATDVINSTFTLAKETAVTLKVVNITGQAVYSLPSTVYPSGTHAIKLNTSGLAKGLYLVEIQGDDFRSQTKIVVR
ncbi:MAG: PKD domain-containing protein [Bacteroidota bacterium]|nr:PKD domain-containing protein [Bacteroidota bacterium]